MLVSALAIVAITAYAAVRSEYPVGCTLRTVPKFSATGTTAKNRFAGYYEAMEVVYHSSMSVTCKSEALDTLVLSPEIEKYTKPPALVEGNAEGGTVGQ